MLRILSAAVGVLVLSTTASAQIIYSNNMNDANSGGTNRYGFGGMYGQDGKWGVTNLPSGGWQGSGAAQVTLNAGHEQYMYGWWTSQTAAWTPAVGDRAFFRFRLKWPAGQPSSSAVRLKFLIFGSLSDGSNNTSRVIVFLGSGGAGGCTLDQGTSLYDGSYREYHKPSDYGVSLSGNAWNGNYAGLAVNRNIEGPGGCATPPVLMTSFNNANRGTPGYNHGKFGTIPGAPASDGWYHVQIEAKSGTPGTAYFKQWANNNNYSTPTSKQDPLRYADGSLMGLGVAGWGGSTIGGYVDTRPSANFSYIIDDFQIARSFDPNWYPGGGATPTSPPAPTNLRIVPGSLEFAGLLLGCVMLVRKVRS